jgi:hypothetical protein
MQKLGQSSILYNLSILGTYAEKTKESVSCGSSLRIKDLLQCITDFFNDLRIIKSSASVDDKRLAYFDLVTFIF